MRLVIDVEKDLSKELTREAIRHRRSMTDQAAVLLRQALGLPFPYPIDAKPIIPQAHIQQKQSDNVQN